MYQLRHYDKNKDTSLNHWIAKINFRTSNYQDYFAFFNYFFFEPHITYQYLKTVD